MTYCRLLLQSKLSSLCSFKQRIKVILLFVVAKFGKSCSKGVQGAGEEIWGMPKRIFFCEVFPESLIQLARKKLPLFGHILPKISPRTSVRIANNFEIGEPWS